IHNLPSRRAESRASEAALESLALAFSILAVENWITKSSQLLGSRAPPATLLHKSGKNRGGWRIDHLIAVHERSRFAPSPRTGGQVPRIRQCLQGNVIERFIPQDDQTSSPQKRCRLRKKELTEICRLPLPHFPVFGPMALRKEISNQLGSVRNLPPAF